jgi:hypothetical protein
LSSKPAWSKTSGRWKSPLPKKVAPSARRKKLADALYDKAGIPVDTLAELNERIKELRDVFRAVNR